MTDEAKTKTPRARWGTSFTGLRLAPRSRERLRRLLDRFRTHGTQATPRVVTERLGAPRGPISGAEIVEWALIALETQLAATPTLCTTVMARGSGVCALIAGHAGKHVQTCLREVGEQHTCCRPDGHPGACSVVAWGE